MHDASEEFFPITDWSAEGRRQYLEQNRACVELILFEALEVFDERRVSLTFGSQEKAKDHIISMFLSDDFNHEKLPRGISHDIKLFSQLDYWCKLKSGRTFGGLQQLLDDEIELTDNYCTEASTFESELDKLSNCLATYSGLVAANMVYFWLKANKKLLDELSNVVYPLPDDKDMRITGSPSKYKADSAFRYLCVFLDIESHIPEFYFYKNKYLTKGENEPQYTASNSEAELHSVKLEVRKVVARIIDYFHRVHCDEPSPLCQVLLKSVGRKSLLDLYKIGEDFSNFEDLGDKLDALKSPLKKEAPYVVR